MLGDTYNAQECQHYLSGPSYSRYFLMCIFSVAVCG